MTDGFYSPKEMAKLLSVSEYTVRKWIRDGKIKNSVKLGHKTIRVPRSAYESFVAESKYK
jgi:excisionase family DNA binding protein